MTMLPASVTPRRSNVSLLESPSRRVVPVAPEASITSMPLVALKLRRPMSTSAPVATMRSLPAAPVSA